MGHPDIETQQSIRRHLRLGAAALLLAGGGAGGWAFMTELSGAVIAQGSLVADSNVKKVQHPTGGVVGELLVHEGDRVKAEDILLRLDQTQTRAAEAIVTKGLDELMARRARLEAESNDLEEIEFPPNLLARLDDADVGRIVTGERKLFELRRAARAGLKAQLRERIAQLQEQIKGLLTQAAAKKREIELVNVELAAVRDLWKKNLVPINRLNSLERDAVKIEGERGQLVAASAEAKGKIAEIGLQIIQIDQDVRSEVAKDLAEVRAKTSELAERKVAADDQLKRVDIRAPQDGRVHQLSVYTVGGVIAPGETIMLIVPEHDALAVEARVAPRDIDQLHYDQAAMLRFSAFNVRTTPEIEGKISRISADLSQDQRTGASYYTVRIAFSEAAAARLGEVKLVPGMPVEAFVQTGQRTAVSYLMKPLSDQIARAFREK